MSGEERTGRSSSTIDRHDDDRRTTQVRTADERHGVATAKTSAAAALALVFGVAALFSALTAVLAPLAVLLALVGIAVGVAGLKMAARPGVTGRGVAIGGLVTAVLGLLLGAAVIAGVSVLVNDEAQLDRLQEQVEELRADLPSTSELRQELPQ